MGTTQSGLVDERRRRSFGTTRRSFLGLDSNDARGSEATTLDANDGNVNRSFRCLRPFDVRDETKESLEEGSETKNSTLLELVAQFVVENISNYPLEHLRALPIDLSQMIVDRLVERDALTKDELRFLEVRELCLDRVTHADDQWLDCLCSPQDLVHLNLAGLTSVRDRSLRGVLLHATKLRTLVLDGCTRLTSGSFSGTWGHVGRGKGVPLHDIDAIQNRSFQGSESPTSTMDFPAEGDIEACFVARPSLTNLVEFSAQGTSCVSRKHGLGLLVKMAPNLERLNLAMCAGLSELGPLASLRRLQVLDLGWCREVCDEDARVIACLPFLEELELSGTSMGDPGLGRLCNLGKLRVLALGGCPLTDEGAAAIFIRAAYASTLHKLDLSRCEKLGNGTMHALASACFKNLEELDVGFTRVRDPGVQSLQGLISLRCLDLDSCQVGDASARAISAMQKLQTLKLADTHVGDGTLNILGEGKCQLVTLDLANTMVTGDGILRLSRSPSAATIKHLCLDSPEITDVAMRHMAPFRSLQTLDLFGSRITDTGLTLLHALEHSLTMLEICSGRITDRGVHLLPRLRRLQCLNLSQNPRVGNEGVSALTKLQHLERLNLAGTSASSLCINDLAFMPSLSLVSLHGCRFTSLDRRALNAKKPKLTVLGIE